MDDGLCRCVAFESSLLVCVLKGSTCVCVYVFETEHVFVHVHQSDSACLALLVVCTDLAKLAPLWLT